KRLLILGAIFAVVFIGFMLYNTRYLGDTLESRTARLQQKGDSVEIFREVIYDSQQNAIISELTDADGRSGIAVFVRNSRGDGYNLKVCEWREAGEIVHATAQVFGTWYHVFLLSAPDLDRAEFLITYEDGGSETWSQDAEGPLLIEMPGKNHDIKVVYHDVNGKTYE
ncbi:MAG: hypothetical protein IIY16_01310, partial [Oscillospiraceae bacterium]|nr:hypothetical protein [Oscillospiraceae bacterium]